jgi:sec-independent protein translocase protein TatA
MQLGWGELVAIFGIIVLLVGARRLPEIGRSLGEAIRSFQESLRGPKPPKDQSKETP